MTTTTGRARKTSLLAVFRIVAVVEAISWLVLIVCTIVKYATSPHKALGVQIMGPTHGVLFIAYVVLAVVLMSEKLVPWNARTLLIVLADSVIPFGGFVVARRADLRRSAVTS